MSQIDRTDKPIARLLTLYSETALHPGTGQTTGVVDLPVQRERHTDLPVLPASSLKGSLREAAEAEWGKGKQKVTTLFGPEPKSGDLHAGALAFGEGQLLAFPVRSLENVFMWVTCPLVLDRLQRESKMLGGSAGIPQGFGPSQGECFSPKDSGLSATVVLEDLCLTLHTSAVDQWTDIASSLASRFVPVGDGSSYAATTARLVKSLLLIGDDDFRYLVRHTTRVAARVALNVKKTTTGGGGNLWYEETLPRDCLFYAWMRCEKQRDGTEGDAAATADLLRHLLESAAYLQIGGNETVGQGWCATRLAGVPGKEAEE